MGGGSGGRCGLVEVIQQLGQPPGISQKEPSQHRLKSRGLPIQGSIAAAGPRSGPVAAAAHLFPLLRLQPGIELLQGMGLGLSLDLRHRGPMEVAGTARMAAKAQPLMQIPDRITEPGQLQGPEVPIGALGRHGRQPQGGGFRLR